MVSVRRCVWVLVLAMAAGVSAQNVHLKGGANARPVFVDQGLSLNVVGALAGLGNGDVLISLSAQADVTSTCTNQGGNQAPGQNPAPITVSGAVAIPEEEIKNGSTPFTVTTVAPSPFIAGAPDCPNSNWVEQISDLAFTSAVITVEQPFGTTVLTVSCVFNPATVNGAVPRASVTCS